MRTRILIIITLFTAISFSSPNACLSFYEKQKDKVDVSTENLARIREFFKQTDGAPSKTSDFVSSELFEKIVMDPTVQEVANYLINARPGKFVALQDGWIRELSRHEPGRTRMPLFTSFEGEFQGSVQIEGKTMILVLTGVAAFNNGQNTLKDGQVAPQGSKFFLKVIAGTMLAVQHLGIKNQQSMDSLIVAAMESVNGNIKASLVDRLGFSSRPTIPKDSRTGQMDDYAIAIKAGADPATLNVISPTDFYFTLNLNSESIQ